MHSWIDWCQKQLADVSRRLFTQGYHPARIEFLMQTEPEFKERFQAFLEEMNLVMDAMAANPEGYHHFEAFTEVKVALLEYTDLNREALLESDRNRDAAQSA